MSSIVTHRQLAKIQPPRRFNLIWLLIMGVLLLGATFVLSLILKPTPLIVKGAPKVPIRSLLVLRNGHVLAGTFKYGIDEFDGNTWHHLDGTEDLGIINAMYELPEGNVLFGTDAEN